MMSSSCYQDFPAFSSLTAVTFQAYKLFPIIADLIEGFDHSGKTAYVKACYKNKVVPVSYYLRHMHESELKLRHHQLGCYAIKPIAISLVVSHVSQRSRDESLMFVVSPISIHNLISLPITLETQQREVFICPNLNWCPSCLHQLDSSSV